jgi:hypothetical protein
MKTFVFTVSFLIFVLCFLTLESFAQLSAPVLVSPENEETDVSLNPTLEWRAVRNADHYTVQVGLDDGFRDPIINERNVTATSYDVRGLQYNTTYYWRIIALNDAGQGGISEVWSFTTLPEPRQAPSAPVLILPEDESTDVSLDPTLVWRPTGDTDHFTLHVSTAANFSTLVVDEGDITDTSYEVNTLEYSTTYYWRVMGHNDVGDSPWSEVWSFTTMDEPVRPPLAVVLISPANGAMDVVIDPDLLWHASENADHYTVQLAPNPNFTNLILNETNVTDTTFQVNALAYSTLYYWRVRGHNDAGAGPWSDAWRFTTMDEPLQPPSAVQLVSPGNGVTGVSVNPTLVWEGSLNAGHYTLQLANDANFNNLVIDEGNIVETSYDVSNLEFITTYYWRVMAHNDAGDSPWSEVWSFTTMDEPVRPPLAVVLISPANGAMDVVTDPELLWHASENADHYTVQLAPNPNFTDLIVNEAGVTDTTYQVNALAYSTLYYWRVRGHNDAGAGPWSDAWRFTTMDEPPQPPLAVELISPEDKSTGVEVNPTLVWETSGADYFTVQLATDDEFNDIAFDAENVTETTYEVNGLDYSSTYFWRVMAHNEVGSSPWSEEWSFTTIDEPVPSPSTPVLISPGNGATDVPLNPTLVWNGSANASEYTLHVAFDPNFANLIVSAGNVADTLYNLNDLANNTLIYWRVRAHNSGGISPWSAAWRFTTQTATNVETLEKEIPVQYYLEQNYPNPFNPSTIIRFGLPEHSTVRLVVTDLLGREIAVLVNGEQAPGSYEVSFEAGDLPSGVYLYRLQVNERDANSVTTFIRSRKMMIVK